MTESLPRRIRSLSKAASVEWMLFRIWLPVILLILTQHHVRAAIQLIPTAYDSHIELIWRDDSLGSFQYYKVYRQVNESGFTTQQTLFPSDTMALDFVGPDQQSNLYDYFVAKVDFLGSILQTSDTLRVQTISADDDALLEMVQRYSLRYFWDFGHPVSGMARERNSSGDLVTTGGTGFGVMAILVGIDRGWISWESGLKRLLKMVLFLEGADRFRGAFPHWMNGKTGRTIPFSPKDDGGDLVETAFLFEGLLTARQYFQGNSPNEVVLREKITKMYGEVDWNWYRKTVEDVLYWHWSPNNQFAINLPIRGWNEAMIIYILAIASPTHPVPARLYQRGWAGGSYVHSQDHFGYHLDIGPEYGGPLFFTHYSFLGLDPRFVRDQYTNYFIHSQRQSLINREYCAANPKHFAGYSASCWGLTASDDPYGYSAHSPTNDNGTITPTAALSSMPYSPEESLEALKNFYRVRGDRLWGPMGFYDAFSDRENWVASSYLAIDQGPIIGMIENYRSQLLWKTFMTSPEIGPALDAVGFVVDSTTARAAIPRTAGFVFPNPASESLTFERSNNVKMQWEVINPAGISVLKGSTIQQSLHIPLHTLPAGLYWLRVRENKPWQQFKIVHIPN